MIQGQELIQYDFTPQQYEALIKLTATLSKVLPKIKCDYPRDAAGDGVNRDRLVAKTASMAGPWRGLPQMPRPTRANLPPWKFPWQERGRN